MKYVSIAAPILAVLLLLGVYLLIRINDHPVQHYEPSPETEVVFDAEEYLRQLKMSHKPFSQGGVHRLLLKRTRQKQGVYLESLEPAMDSVGLEIVNAFHQVMGFEYVPVITSGNDYPYHVRNSKHYENKALDFRLKGLLYEERKSVIEIAQEKLKGRARVLWERGEAEHLHVELLD